jgi:hypothetical protein
LRYSTPNLPAALVPIAMLLPALVFGFILWIKNKWPWLFLATLSVFIAEGTLRESVFGFVAGNGTEVLFQIAMLETELLVTSSAKPPSPV